MAYLVFGDDFYSENIQFYNHISYTGRAWEKIKTPRVSKWGIGNSNMTSNYKPEVELGTN